jgi:hypothetical protein
MIFCQLGFVIRSPPRFLRGHVKAYQIRQEQTVSARQPPPRRLIPPVAVDYRAPNNRAYEVFFRRQFRQWPVHLGNYHTRFSHFAPCSPAAHIHAPAAPIPRELAYTPGLRLGLRLSFCAYSNFSQLKEYIYDEHDHQKN